MTALTASTTRLRRHPSWYAPLLLPLLPLIAPMLPTSVWRPPPSANSSEALLWLVVLGVFLTWGVPDFLNRLGWGVRKEAEQLRPFWLAGLFLVQAPLLIDARGISVTWIFVGLCALLAAVPFGMEFQQRTLSGLLSQPVGRRELWLAKMGTLAGALLSLWAVQVLSVVASGRSAFAPTIGISIVVALVAWGTTPYWTMVTRGLMSGLVFSIALPLLPLLSLALVQEIFTDPTKVPEWRGIAGLAPSVLGGVLAIYAGLGAYLTARVWRRLEAPDAGEAVVTSLWRTRETGYPTRRGRARIQSPWRWLLGKELRLQWVTLVVFALMLAMSAVLLVVSPMRSVYTFLQGSVFLLAWATILVAGSTAVAEERRMGTLDGQVLLPVSRSGQWWMKVGVATAFSLVAWAEVAWTTQSLISVTRAITLGVAVAALPLALLASSGSSNALRALVFSLVLVASVSVGVTVIPGAAEFVESRLSETAWTESFTQPERWLERARRLTDAEAWALRGTGDEWSWGRPRMLTHCLWIPTLFVPLWALWQAGRNFASPSAAPRRVTRQAVVSLLLLVAALVSGGAIYAWMTYRWLDRQNLHAAFRWLEVDRTLSPAERQLRAWKGHGIYAGRGLQVLLRTPEEEADARKGGAGRKHDFRLPLSAEDRQLMIDQAVIPDDLRTALREEAVADGER